MAPKPPDPLALVELASHEDILLALDSDLEAIDKEIEERCADLNKRKQELLASRRTWLSQQKSHEKALLTEMQARGMTRWENDEVLITVRKGAQSCIIDSQGSVPEHFKEREIVEKVDKLRLKAHLIAHPSDSVGAHLERGPSKLIVKWKEKKDG